MSSPSTCPSADQLRQLLDDALSGETQSALQAHLETCPTCRHTLDRLAASGPSWDRAARHLGTPGEPTEPALAQAVVELQGTDLNMGTPSGAETQGEARPPTGDELAFLDPPAEPGHLGRLAHYAVLGIVGRGGMGVVLKARDDRLQRVVALKVLGAQFAASGSARKRFEREAKAAAAVSHDHIVPIYHVDEHRGMPFLVMPLIAGKSLQERIDQDGPLELKEILRIGSQTACGLAAAHKQGLVHRDIKPANILLENGVERVKITDFGLARAVDDASVTQSGVITGTPMFMSPEQARGEFTIDARSDLFSLGSVIYVMATGRPPFRASGTHAVLRRVIDDAPRPMREVNSDIPDWLEAIVARLHAKNPADRFQTAQEVADLLGEHLAHLQDPQRVQRPAPVIGPALVEPVPGRMERLLDATDTRRHRMQVGGAIAGMGLCVFGLLGVVGSLRFFGPSEIAVGAVLLVLGLLVFAIAAGIRQRWVLQYRGHTIRIENGCLSGVALFIDDIRSAHGGGSVHVEMRAGIRGGAGAGDEIVVLCDAALLSFRCRVYVESHVARVASSRPAPRPRHEPASNPWPRVAVILTIVLGVMGCGIAFLMCGVPVGLALIGFFAIQAPEMRGPVAHVVELAQPIPMLDEEWLPLFNGQDTNGWTVAPQDKGNWFVDKLGNLVGEGKVSPSYLLSERDDFADFHLRAEVNPAGISAGAICFRCGRELLKDKGPPGYETRIGPGVLFGQPYQTGTLILRAPGAVGPILWKVEKAPVPDNAWFTVEIVARGKHILVKVDGKTVADYRDDKESYTQGRIALQAFAPQTAVHFRKIEIKRLPDGW